jgi:hypothetical protein
MNVRGSFLFKLPRGHETLFLFTFRLPVVNKPFLLLQILPSKPPFQGDGPSESSTVSRFSIYRSLLPL